MSRIESCMNHTCIVETTPRWCHEPRSNANQNAFRKPLSKPRPKSPSFLRFRRVNFCSEIICLMHVMSRQTTHQKNSRNVKGLTLIYRYRYTERTLCWWQQWLYLSHSFTAQTGTNHTHHNLREIVVRKEPTEVHWLCYSQPVVNSSAIDTVDESPVRHQSNDAWWRLKRDR